jgi:hypothetical protein
LWVDRQYYPDGKLHKEIHYRGKKPHGFWREWHQNGVLAAEYEFEDGIYMNTVIRRWGPEGRLRAEITHVNGAPTGRISAFNDRGKLLYRCYMLDGKSVSRERYDKACESRSELPKYSDPDPPGTWGLPKSKKRVVPKVTPAPLGDDFYADVEDEVISRFLASDIEEAWTWLKENEDRNLGEMSAEESADFVAKAYNAGAVRVIAVEIAEETTNHLLLELPTQAAKRRRVFAFEKKQAESEGFDGEEDRGQRFLYLKLC